MIAGGQVVWIDGEIVEPTRATVAITDPGFLLGHGIFETMKSIGGEPLAVTRHLRRLRRSGELTGVSVPWADAELRAACETVARAVPVPDTGFARIRLTVTAGGSLSVIGFPAPAFAPLALLATVDAPINERSPIVGAKTTSQLEQIWCRAHAERHGVDDVVRTNTAGHLCDGAVSNLFLVLEGNLVTPSLATGCLPGITRELVLEIVDVRERGDLTADDLVRADELFITSSTRDVHPVTSIDGRPLSAPGPITDRVRADYAALLASNPDP